MMEQIWDEYQVYSKDELDMVKEKVELSRPDTLKRTEDKEYE